ncbi:MAG: succinylglutamate desuccinylase/aspartoacylase family protein [Thermodesulfobacteriota bacterium]
MAKKVFELEGISAKPGTLGKGFIKVGEFWDNSPVNMPVMILNGAGEGPTLLMMSAVHGNEVVGTEAIKRIMTGLDPKKVNGTIIGIPVVNIPAYLESARINLMEQPAGDNDLSGMIRKGGGVQGPQSQTIANFLHEKVFPRAEVVLDLHSSAPGTFNYPRAIVIGDHIEIPKALRERCMALGVACNYEFVFKPGRPAWTGMYFAPGSMFETKYGIPALILETGAAPTTDDVESILYGIDNVLKHLKMIPGDPAKKNKQVYIDRLVAVRAQRGGMFRLMAKMCDRVKKGDVIGEVTNLFNEVVETIRAPEDGVIIKIATSALICTGIRAAVVATPAK